MMIRMSEIEIAYIISDTFSKVKVRTKDFPNVTINKLCA